MKCLQAESAAELDTLVLFILDCALKINTGRSPGWNSQDFLIQCTDALRLQIDVVQPCAIIQRPFVWKNAKVRDLFDSMYRGYPVGYLLFWQNALTEDAKAIGEENKQKPPRLLIVDGQQRLTSCAL